MWLGAKQTKSILLSIKPKRLNHEGMQYQATFKAEVQYTLK